MKRFLTTTALALTLSTGAYAEAHNMGIGSTTAREATQFYGSDLIGMRIYSSEADYENNSQVQAGANAEWDDIGEINDLIVSADGQVEAVILGIGGFLGIGERDVSVSMESIRILSEQDNPGSRFLVVNTTKEALEVAPEFDTSDRVLRQEQADQVAAQNEVNTTAPADNMTQETDQAMADDNADATQETDQAMADDNADATQETDQAMADENADTNEQTAEMADDGNMGKTMLDRPAVTREGYADAEMADLDKLTAEDVTGMRVYGENDEDLGEVSELVIAEGKLTDAVIDVGGFLGMGEKNIAVPFEQLQIMKNAEGDDWRIYMDSSEEKLESMPEYDG